MFIEAFAQVLWYTSKRLQKYPPPVLARYLIRFEGIDARRTPDEYRWMSKFGVAHLTLDEHMELSKEIVRIIVTQWSRRYEITGIVSLYSGGNDSTAFVHMLRDVADRVVHIKTGIGIPETTTHVRRMCREWGLPLMLMTPREGDRYRDLVLKYGFPGPGGHGLMYRHLKERQLRRVRKHYVSHPRKERVIFLAGVRNMESDRRMKNTQLTHTDGSIVWISPIAWWPTPLLKEYRERFSIPENEVSAHLHMSGECLCGAFAKPGELEQIAFFYPEVADHIRSLEAEVAAQEGMAGKCVWGQRPTQSVGIEAGPICQKCEG